MRRPSHLPQTFSNANLICIVQGNVGLHREEAGGSDLLCHQRLAMEMRMSNSPTHSKLWSRNKMCRENIMSSKRLT